VNRPARAAIYLRVSSDKQTVENQRPEVEQVARARGFEVVAVYEEQASAAKHRSPPEHEVLVSPALQRDWHNGKRYYPFDHRKLVALPDRKNLLPSARALEWHLANVFRRAS
jgi:hypothetical protein